MAWAQYRVEQDYHLLIAMNRLLKGQVVEYNGHDFRVVGFSMVHQVSQATVAKIVQSGVLTPVPAVPAQPANPVSMGCTVAPSSSSGSQNHIETVARVATHTALNNLVLLHPSQTALSIKAEVHDAVRVALNAEAPVTYNPTILVEIRGRQVEVTLMTGWAPNYLVGVSVGMPPELHVSATAPQPDPPFDRSKWYENLIEEDRR